MELCSDHCERSEVAIVHLLYSDESAIGIAELFNRTEVEGFIACAPLGAAKIQKCGPHLLRGIAIRMRQHAGKPVQSLFAERV